MKDRSQRLNEKRKRREKRKLERDGRLLFLAERHQKRNKLKPAEFNRNAFNNIDSALPTKRVFKSLRFDRKAWAPPNE